VAKTYAYHPNNDSRSLPDLLKIGLRGLEKAFETFYEERQWEKNASFSVWAKEYIHRTIQEDIGISDTESDSLYQNIKD